VPGMRPIVILQHEHGVSAGHFAAWLAARSLPHHLVSIHHGEPVPPSAAPYAGVCSLGGDMSANDPLPWIGEELALLEEYRAEQDAPRTGHGSNHCEKGET